MTLPIRTIGITGGIGSGKSEVRKFLVRLGYPCADADGFAADILSSPNHAPTIASEFGGGVLTDLGTVDRVALRGLVFGDPEARARLEALMHPWIQERFETWRRVFVNAHLPCQLWLFYEASLLVEKNRKGDFDRLVLVTASSETRKNRVRSRGLKDDAFNAIVAAQASDAARRQVCDFTLLNDGTLVELRQSVFQMLGWLADEFSQS